MKSIAKILGLLLACTTLPAAATVEEEATRDSLGAFFITCTPGGEIYQYYGHTALWIQNYTTGQEAIFDYGVFDFDSPNFIWRFCLGHTDYTVGGADAGRFFYRWQQQGCTVIADRLLLGQDELHRLSDAVLENYETPGWTYRYNVFYDNCATRVRDLIEHSLNGHIVYADSVKPQSLRDIVHTHSRGYDWSTFGQDLLLGAQADKGANRSEQQFAPLVLRETLISAQVDRNGLKAPLFGESFKTAQGYRDADREAAIEADKAKFPSPMTCAKVLLVLVIVLTIAEWLLKRTLWGLDLVLMVAQGLAGCLVAFMFFFSTHPTVGSNWLLLMLNPLPLVFLYPVIKKERRKQISIYHIVVAIITFLIACNAVPQYLSPEIRLVALALFLRSLIYNPAVMLRSGKSKGAGRNKLPILITLLLLPAAADAQSIPRLVINIAVDGLRSDYLQAFLPLYGEGGFKKLLSEGRVYEQAEFPQSRLSRAAGVATIQTGTVPYNHGIVDERWLDRETLKTIYCVDDDTQTGLLTSDRCSAQSLQVSTVGDELKVATQGTAQVYSIAPFRDAAVLGAGHAADGAFWINDLTGHWCGTEYYGAIPAWVRFENESSAPAVGINKLTWQPLGDLNGNFNYFLSGGVKTPFSYNFKGNNQYKSLLTSGLVNGYVTSLARACIERSTIGRDDTPDYLSLCYYAGEFEPVVPRTDGSTADYGEIQDTYIRLDRALADLLETVEEKVGLQNALIVLTSTGPNDAETADLSEYRIPTGTFYINRTAGLLNLYLAALYGKGQYVQGYYENELYFNLKLLEQKQLALSDILARAQELLLQSEGVKDVYTSTRLLLGAWTPGISKLRNSYCPSTSGDVMIQVAPGWKLVNEVEGTEKLIRDSNIPFPLIIYGSTTQAATISTPVTTDQIAPTLARALRIRAPNACTAEALRAN